MKRVLLMILLGVGGVGLSSCGTGVAGVPVAPMAPGLASYSEGQAGSFDGPSRMLRREGRVAVKARSLESCSEACVGLVEQFGGRMESSDLSEERYAASIRVPTAHLEGLMEELCGLGKVTTRRVSEDDVTEAWRDLEAALVNQRALRDRLRVLLEKAENVEEMLAVEKELARVQTELDQMEGSLMRLKSQVALSELDFSAEREKVPGPLGVVKDGTGWVLKKLFVLN
ncbi:MAG: DUF4349 domain-containing protein [Verrucomicrobiota bacterium]